MKGQKVRRGFCLFAAIVTLGGGCASIPGPEPTNSARGWEFCRDVEKAARSHADTHAFGGWTLGTIAVGSIAAGAVMVGTADNPSRKEKIVSLSLPLFGALVGYGASGLLDRAKQDSEFAAAAALATNETEQPSAIKLCNQALAAWETSRPDANAAMITALQAKKQADEATQKAEAADKKADSAEEKASNVETKLGKH